jgi:hypothetical protein
VARESIAWHEQCLKNVEHSTAQRRANLERELARLTEDETRVVFYRDQIAEAKKRGMDAFDRDRLLVKRAGKS